MKTKLMKKLSDILKSFLFKVLHKYAKEEDADNALKSFGRIIPAKIKELKTK